MFRRSWKQSLVYLASWIGGTLVTVFDLWIVGSAIMSTTLWFGAHRSEASRRQDLLSGGSFGWMAELVGQITLFVLVCAGLASVLWLEYHYRVGMDKGVLGRRVRKVTLVQLAIAGIGVTVILLTHLIW